MASNMYKLVFLLFFHIILNLVCAKNISSDYKYVCERGIYLSRCGCGQETDEFSNIPLFTIDCSRLEFITIPGSEVLSLLVGRFDISHNAIEYLNETVHLCSGTLQYLDTSFNKIQSISKYFFKECTNLRYLNLQHNRLGNIEAGLFDDLNKLSTLNLQANELLSLPQEAFSHLISLRTLILSNNNLGNFLENVKLVDYMPESEISLYLDNINMKNMKPHLFKELHLLKKLSITYNNIQVLPSLLLNKLEYLDVSNTNISLLIPMNMNYPNLKVLKLNRLPYLTNISDFTFYHLKVLENLEIEHCIRLENIDSLLFGFTNINDKPRGFNLTRVSFAHNTLTTLNYSLYSIFGSLKEINLSGNKWNCDCKLKWIEDLQDILQHKSDTKCTTPEKLAGKAILEVKLHDMSCFEKSTTSTADMSVKNWLFALVGILTLIVIGLVALLIYMGPYGDYLTSVNRTIGPDSPYSPITIQPNQAEHVDEDIEKIQRYKY